MDLFWYYTLNKPIFTPPAFVFAPAWIVLYVLIILAFFEFVKTGISKEKIIPLILFFLQLILNFSWSPVFFYFHNMMLALLIIIGIIVILFATMWNFYKFSKLSAFLLIPYFLWLIFATYLNIWFLILN